MPDKNGSTHTQDYVRARTSGYAFQVMQWPDGNVALAVWPRGDKNPLFTRLSHDEAVALAALLVDATHE